LSTLHKIFTVLMTVFSIAFSMMFIFFATQVNDWKDLAENYQQQLKVSETYQRNLVATHAAELAAIKDAQEALRTQSQTIQGNLDRTTQQGVELQAKLAQLEAEKAALQSQNSTLAGEVKVAQGGWQSERGQRETLENRNLDLEKRNIDIVGQVNELTAQVLVLSQEKRQFQQENNLLRGENERLAGTRGVPPTAPSETVAGGDMGGVIARTDAVRDAIRGRIVQVDGKYAMVSVGSADGVKQDMVFVIYRGAEFVGELKISEVEPEMAAGTLVRTRSVPQIDDTVADSAGFGYAG